MNSFQNGWFDFWDINHQAHTKGIDLDMRGWHVKLGSVLRFSQSFDAKE